MPELATAPLDLGEIAHPYWSAFWTLNRSRPISMGGMGGALVGHIPFDAIDRYAQRAGITDQAEWELFLRLITALDILYQRRMSETLNKR